MRTSPLLLFRELRGPAQATACELLALHGCCGHRLPPLDDCRLFSVEDPADDPGSLPAAVAATTPTSSASGVDLRAFVVHPDCRGRGVGGHLISGLADRLRVDGFRYVVASVDHPDVRRLLRRSGFVSPTGPLTTPDGAGAAEIESGGLVLSL